MSNPHEQFDAPPPARCPVTGAEGPAPCPATGRTGAACPLGFREVVPLGWPGPPTHACGTCMRPIPGAAGEAQALQMLHWARLQGVPPPPPPRSRRRHRHRQGD